MRANQRSGRGLWLDPHALFAGDTRQLRAVVELGCATPRTRGVRRPPERGEANGLNVPTSLEEARTAASLPNDMPTYGCDRAIPHQRGPDARNDDGTDEATDRGRLPPG
jgi:hypothetical protein